MYKDKLGDPQPWFYKPKLKERKVQVIHDLDFINLN